VGAAESPRVIRVQDRSCDLSCKVSTKPEHQGGQTSYLRPALPFSEYGLAGGLRPMASATPGLGIGDAPQQTP